MHHDLSCGQEFQLLAFNAVVQAIEGLPIELIIKAHAHEEEASWRRALRQSGVKNPVVFEKHNADFFKLITSCDAIAAGYWTTAFIEAAICNKSAYFLDTKNALSDLFIRKEVEPYFRLGFCQVVRDAAALREKLIRLCGDVSFPQQVFEAPSEEERIHFLGSRDAKSTERAVDYMIQSSNLAVDDNSLECH